MENIGLYLYCKTFITSYVGVFTFEPEKIVYKLLFINNSCFLFKTQNNDMATYNTHSDCKTGESCILEVIYKDYNFYLKSPIFPKPREPEKKIINLIKNKIWYRINTQIKIEKNNKNEIKEELNENEDYYLNKNDIIKLGTEIYILREIVFNNKNDIEINYNSFNKKKRDLFILCTEPRILDEKNFCKDIIENLKDSKKVEEIQKWYDNYTRKHFKKNIESYYIPLYKCEKCNKIYPLKYKFPEDRDFNELLKIEKPDKNYIILESVEEIEKNKKEESKKTEPEKEIHIIILSGENEKKVEKKEEKKDEVIEEIKIGRGKNNDVVLLNETISENHAVIQFIKNGENIKKLLLKNKSQSSGTLVLIQDELTTISNENKNKIFLQVGSTFIEASIMSKNKFDEIKKEEEPKIEEIKKRIKEKNKISKRYLEEEKKEKDIYGE